MGRLITPPSQTIECDGLSFSLSELACNQLIANTSESPGWFLLLALEGYQRKSSWRRTRGKFWCTSETDPGADAEQNCLSMLFLRSSPWVFCPSLSNGMNARPCMAALQTLLTESSWFALDEIASPSSQILRRLLSRAKKARGGSNA